MAIFASSEKQFEITALSFAPNSITFNEETSYSITVKNLTGRKITQMRAVMHLSFRDVNGKPTFGNAVDVYSGTLEAGFKSISWAAGKTYTFTGKFKAPGTPSKDDRRIPTVLGSEIGFGSSSNEVFGLSLFFTAEEIFSTGRNTDYFTNLRGENDEYLKVYDARYVPTISAFSAVRSKGSVENDEGENVLSTIKLALQDSAHYERLSLCLRYRDKAIGGAYTELDISDLMKPALENEIIVPIERAIDAASKEYLVLGKDSDWDMQLLYGDDFEMATSPVKEPFVLPRAFANVHLSGSRYGGVCFGSFSRATPETDKNGLFQCYYPTEFDKGIRGGLTYDEGEVNTGGRWIDGEPIWRKVVPFTVTTTNAKTAVADIPGIATLVRLDGFANRTAAVGTFVGILHWFSTTDYNSAWIESGKLYVKTSHAIKGYAIVEYTKTKEAST